MSKSFPHVIATFTAVFGLTASLAAQTLGDASQQRPTEAVPSCVPATTSSTTPEITPPLPTLTVYNPVLASAPPLTLYNPSTFQSPALTYYTPLGQIDPPIRITTPSSTFGQTTQSTSSTASQRSMPTTQTIASPGPCPPGTQIERPAR